MNDSLVPRIRGMSGYGKEVDIRNDTIFSRHTSMPLDCRQTLRNNNVLILGSSYNSVVNHFIRPNLAQANSSFIVHDVGGAILEDTRDDLEKMGYEIRVLNLLDFAQSNKYNPFCYLRSEEDFFDMADSFLRNTMPGGSDDFCENFFYQAERFLFIALCQYLISEKSEEYHNFHGIIRLLKECPMEDGPTGPQLRRWLDERFKELEERDSTHSAVKFYKAYREICEKEKILGVPISLLVRLSPFNIESIQTATNTDDIDLSSIGDKKVALFCVVFSYDTSFHFLASMLYQQAFSALYYYAQNDLKMNSLSVPVRFYFPCFDSVGFIPRFDFRMATMRPYHISCMLSVATLAFLKCRFGDEWPALVGNCDTILLYDLARGRVGSEELEFWTKKFIRSGERGLRDLRNGKRFLGIGQKKTDLTEELLLYMAVDDCIVWVRGTGPIIDNAL